jgi:radical SAM protein with 4Fe4S-binding SPASM domain
MRRLWGMRRLMRYYPRHLLLQWHITNRCNLNCLHCYQDDSLDVRDDCTFQELHRILEQFRAFLHAPCQMGHPIIPGHITLAGGEPFLREDLPELLNLFSTYQKEFSFAILTNGLLIDQRMANQLRQWGVGFVQVSMEGDPETHDQIRGKGNFRQVVRGIRYLAEASIRTLISFTAHQMNSHAFPQVAQWGKKLNVFRVWADRLIPQGRGAALQNLILSPEGTRRFFEQMLQSRKRAEHTWFCRTEIAMHRALQFLIAGGRPYACSAGDSLIAVMANGDMYPCARVPIQVGNLLKTPLHELYDCPLFHSLRDSDRVIKGCEECFYQKLCRGGLRCLAYSMTGDMFQADPGCWRAKNQILSTI